MMDDIKITLILTTETLAALRHIVLDYATRYPDLPPVEQVAIQHLLNLLVPPFGDKDHTD